MNGPRPGSAGPALGYPVVVDSGAGVEGRLCAALLEALPALRDGACLALVTDENVARLHGPRYEHALRQHGVRLLPAVVPPGEGSKSLAQVERLCGELLARGLDRGGALLALGGGVVSDLAGFTAAVLLRGLPWAAVPTTLLSQVDAALGGKTGVNLALGKNLVGAFHDPRLFYADLSSLHTLPPREIASGLGEVLKHALLLGEDTLRLLEERAEALGPAAPGPDQGLLRELLVRSLRCKAAVVAQDPQERDGSGGRALLNLGHTLGHALESGSAGSDDPLRHGEAVALGLLAAARVSEGLGLLRPGLEARLRRLLPRLGLPTDLDARLWDPDGALRADVRAALRYDKKRAGQALRFVVLCAPGHAELRALSLTELLPLLHRARQPSVSAEETR